MKSYGLCGPSSSSRSFELFCCCSLRKLQVERGTAVPREGFICVCVWGSAPDGLTWQGKVGFQVVLGFQSDADIGPPQSSLF